MMSICDIVKKKVSDYLFPSLSISQMDKILEHLVKCDTCRNFYINYAKEKGYHFDLTREILKLEIRSLKDAKYQGRTLYCMTALLKTEPEQDKETTALIIANNNAVDWVTHCEHSDYPILMNSKAIREIMISQNANKSNDDSINDFTKFLIKKVCKRLNHLERCYAKTESGR